MDRKSISIIVLCIALLVAWQFILVPKFTPPPQPGATNSFIVSNGVVQGTLTNPSQAAPQLEAAVRTAAAMPRPIANTNIPEQLLVVATSEARYIFTSYGGGLKQVELLRYPEKVASRPGKKTETNTVTTLNLETPAPTLAILDDSAIQGDGIFALTKTSAGIRAEKTLPNGLRIVKDFSIDSNYLVSAVVQMDNTSTQALSLPKQEWVVGTATPMSLSDTAGSAGKYASYTVGTMWYNGEKAHDILGAGYFSSRGFACTTRIPPVEYNSGTDTVVWAAVHNQFFTLALMPPLQQPASAVVMHPIPLGTQDPQTPVDAANPPPQGYFTTLVYPAFSIAPHTNAVRQFTLFAGPKEYRTLAVIAAKLDNGVDKVMGFDSVPPFYKIGGFFARGLLLAMNGIHAALRLPYGWTIIAITILIKALFWPLTQASTRSMKRMQELQPQVKAIQEKYKADPLKVQKKMMELWKENRVSPMSGCWPMMIQMPVLFGFYSMIRSAIELRGASFLWVADLSKPDTLLVLPGMGWFPFIGMPGVGLPLNPLPLLMAGTQVWQAHLTPTSPGADPAQQKMMRFMPLIMIAIFYNLPAGLTLYYTVQSILTIIQTKLTKVRPAGAAAGPGLTTTPKKNK